MRAHMQLLITDKAFAPQARPTAMREAAPGNWIFRRLAFRMQIPGPTLSHVQPLPRPNQDIREKKNQPPSLENVPREAAT